MEEYRPKSRKPANTAFKQQRLKAWQPVLTPKAVLPLFFIVGIIFVPIGIGLYVTSQKVNEVMFDYTDCSNAPATLTAPTTLPSWSPITSWSYDTPSQTCTIQFTVPSEFAPPVFMYYRLTNFFQNHRRYVKSFDSTQLSGSMVSSAGSINSQCDPLRFASCSNPAATSPYCSSQLGLDVNAQIYPAGLIANSMFTDQIGNLTCISTTSTWPNGAVCASGTTAYTFVEKGIAWPADSARYASTDWSLSANASQISSMLLPPPAWRSTFAKWSNGYNATNLPNLGTWERFQVWMRTAGLPTFRKLWGRNDASSLYPAVWQVQIQSLYNVTSYGGTKSIVISTTSVLGGKNNFLGSAYLVVGVLCWVFGIAFLARHMLYPRKLGDHTYLSWNNASPGAPNAVGASR
ncbi:hypothetical protein SmJEL517_g03849 [Synchytrium microbalum]|uniref:ALA-interacting subunit n=1 Tax=Synchytrium microbalum TaxID=1806994 RepID=A0A507C6Y8_9FUNG|nr:uncharacterized protein SmJEL517_g03849 [Synchytrium microbalum]TPX33245.1 hypothetical protein SmJEL517_g03849 [Synchytrium microbalum]